MYDVQFVPGGRKGENKDGSFLAGSRRDQGESTTLDDRLASYPIHLECFISLLPSYLDEPISHAYYLSRVHTVRKNKPLGPKVEDNHSAVLVSYQQKAELGFQASSRPYSPVRKKQTN